MKTNIILNKSGGGSIAELRSGRLRCSREIAKRF